MPTAALLLESLALDDESFPTFDFSAAHGGARRRRPDERTIRCWHLVDGAYVEQPRSALLDEVDGPGQL